MAKPVAPKTVKKPGTAPKKPAYPTPSQQKFSSKLYQYEQIRAGKVPGKKLTASQEKERAKLLGQFHTTKEYKSYAAQKQTYTTALSKYNASAKAYTSYQASYAKYEKALTAYNAAMQTVEGRLGGLAGADRDAAAALTNLFKNYGLDTLSPKIIDYVKRGYGADTIGVLLQETKEYKTRFAGNEERKKKGLPVLSPAEYLATESAYKQVLSQAGLPANFYDKPEDFNNWIGRDVSPTEIQERAKAANDIIRVDGSWAKTTIRDYYGVDVSDGALAAYMLDPTKALPLIQEQVQTVQIGAGAAQYGMRGQVDKERAEQLRALGVTGEQAQKGYGAISELLPQSSHLAAIYGEEYDIRDAEQEVLLGDARAEEKRKRLSSRERGTFGTRSGVQQGSLSPGYGQT